MEIYKGEKRRVKKSKKKTNEQFGRKLNQDVVRIENGSGRKWVK